MVSSQLLIAAAFVFTLIYIWKMRHFIYATFKIKGPFVLPIVGNALEYIGNSADITQSMARLVKTYGNTHRVWIGNKFVVLITHPEDIKIVLNHQNCLMKDDSYRFMADFFGQGLFTFDDVSKWRRNRKLITPTFSTTILNGFMPIFEEQVLILCEKLEKMVGKSEFDIYPFLSHCHLDIICETALGAKTNAQTNHCEYTDWIDRSLEIVFKRMFSPLYHYDFIFKWTKTGEEAKYLKNCIRNYNHKIIKEKRELYRVNKTAELNKVFLDHFIKISEKTGHLTDEDISDELSLMIFAGHDTATTAESFLFIMLGMHPEIQDKVFAEQEAIFGNSNRSISLEDISQMKYLKNVIKESMRLFPPGPFLGRTVTEAVKIRNCTLPKGTSCFIGVYFTHRDPKIWKDPLTFDPDRFLSENVADRHPYSWIPFSAGPRNCIGLRYGMIVMKIVVSMVIRKYKVFCSNNSVDEITIKADVTLKAMEGHKISLQLRKAVNEHKLL